ncbi:MAG: type II secretion system protein N [Gammaproteobacteria bacterium]
MLNFLYWFEEYLKKTIMQGSSSTAAPIETRMESLNTHYRTRKLHAWRVALLTSPSHNWLDSRLGKSFHIGIHLILLGLIAAVVVSLADTLITHRPEVSRKHDGVAVATPPAAGVERIIAAHLFGQPAMAAAPAISEAVPANIELAGIIYSNERDASRAILTVSGNATVVHTGDTLADGTQVTGIESTRVLLTRDGTLSSLSMSFIGNSAGNISSPALQATNMLAGRIDASTENNYSTGAVVTASGPTLKTVSIPTSANPLDQMRSLRSQLIRGHHRRYLDKSQLVRKPPGH